MIAGSGSVITDVITLNISTVQTGSEAMPRMKFSLAAVCAITAIVAVPISHAVTSWKLHKANAEIEWLKTGRIESWPAPEMVSVLSVSNPSNSFRPANGVAQWQWKVMLLSSATFCLHCDPTSKTLDVAPKTLGTAPATGIELPAGQFDLNLEVRKLRDGDCQLKIVAAGDTTIVPLSKDCDIFDKSGYRINIAGIRQTSTGPPENPFLLACVREHATSGTPSEGLKLWLEPTP